MKPKGTVLIIGGSEDRGVISLDAQGNFDISFNSPHMLRAWKSADAPLEIRIYKE